MSLPAPRFIAVPKYNESAIVDLHTRDRIEVPSDVGNDARRRTDVAWMIEYERSRLRRDWAIAEARRLNEAWEEMESRRLRSR